jgi:nucleotide-binding universal stress UspA family protein/GNAT superfamily N-acetyltransferase
MVTLAGGARVALRPIAPEDAPLITASFERLSKESRYRRLFTHKDALDPDELAYLVDVDHQSHEAIIAVDPSNSEALGVARYIRSEVDEEVAEVAVTVADDWQRRGLGRALLERLASRARREGIHKFNAFVMSENPGAVKLLTELGETQALYDTGPVELVVELPARRGIGAQLAKALRAAAAGSVVPAKTLAHRIADSAGSSPRASSELRPARTIVVGADGSETGEKALAVALELGGVLGAALHVVSAYSPSRGSSDADAVLEAASRAASAQGLQAFTHARRDDPSEALIAVADEHDADLVVVGATGRNDRSRLLGSVADSLSRNACCSVLIVRRVSDSLTGHVQATEA